jgi:uncharacterized protein (DUF2147 family)
MRNPAGRLAAAAWLAVALGMAAMARAADPVPTQTLGNWLTEKKEAVIHISLGVGGLLEGRVLHRLHPAAQGDSKSALALHASAAKESAPQESAPPTALAQDAAPRAAEEPGELILSGMNYQGAGNWSGGTIYDPRSGRTYRARLQLLDAEHLNVRGFVGIEMLGRTQVWTRYHGAL